MKFKKKIVTDVNLLEEVMRLFFLKHKKHLLNISNNLKGYKSTFILNK